MREISLVIVSLACGHSNQCLALWFLDCREHQRDSHNDGWEISLFTQWRWIFIVSPRFDFSLAIEDLKSCKPYNGKNAIRLRLYEKGINTLAMLDSTDDFGKEWDDT